MRKILLALCFALLPSAAFAQAAAGTPNQPIFPGTINRGILQLCAGSVTGCSNTTADTYVTLYTAGSKGSRCKAMWMTTSDGTATHLVTVAIKNSTTTTPLVAVTTVLGAGTLTGVPPVNMMSPTITPGLPLDQNGNQYFDLINGDTLAGEFHTAFTAATYLEIFAACSDF